MPYGLFDYGETIQTMGLSPLPNQVVKVRADDFDPRTTYNNMTDAFPEDGRAKFMADERPRTGTTAYPEEPTNTPVTLMHPEDGRVKIRADEAPPSGGCPKGYEPSGGGNLPTQRPPSGGNQFYDRPDRSSGRPTVTLAYPE